MAEDTDKNVEEEVKEEGVTGQVDFEVNFDKNVKLESGLGDEILNEELVKMDKSIT